MAINNSSYDQMFRDTLATKATGRDLSNSIALGTGAQQLLSGTTMYDSALSLADTGDGGGDVSNLTPRNSTVPNTGDILRSNAQKVSGASGGGTNPTVTGGGITPGTGNVLASDGTGGGDVSNLDPITDEVKDAAAATKEEQANAPTLTGDPRYFNTPRPSTPKPTSSSSSSAGGGLGPSSSMSVDMSNVETSEDEDEQEVAEKQSEPSYYEQASRLDEIRSNLLEGIRADQATFQQDVGRTARDIEQRLYTDAEAQKAALTGYADGTQKAITDNLSATQMQTLTDFYSQARSVSGELASEVNNVDFNAMAQLSGMQQTELQSEQIKEAMAPLLKARYDVQLSQGAITEEQYNELVSGVQPYIDLSQQAAGTGAAGEVEGVTFGDTNPETGQPDVDPDLTDTGGPKEGPEGEETEPVMITARLEKNIAELNDITTLSGGTSNDSNTELADKVKNVVSDANLLSPNNIKLFRADETGAPLATISDIKVTDTPIGQAGFNDSYKIIVNDGGTSRTLELDGHQLSAAVVYGASFADDDLRLKALKTLTAGATGNVANLNAFDGFGGMSASDNNTVKRALLATLMKEGYLLKPGDRGYLPSYQGALSDIETLR